VKVVHEQKGGVKVIECSMNGLENLKRFDRTLRTTEQQGIQVAALIRGISECPGQVSHRREGDLPLGLVSRCTELVPYRTRGRRLSKEPALAGSRIAE
jgi:hypothetical protein